MKIQISNGLHDAINKRVFILGFRYNYDGIVKAVDTTFVTLEKTLLVFDTGDLKENNWAQAEIIKNEEVHVAIAAIESWVYLKD